MLPSAVSGAAPLALQAAIRCISTSSSAAAAAPALAASKGVFGASRVDVPLTEALPTTAPPLKSSIPSAPPKLQSTELAGHKVVAIDSPGPVSTISLALGAGPAYEASQDGLLGASKVLAELAFKASSNRTTFRITRELEKIGAVGTASVARDSLALSVSAPKLHTPEAAELILDTVLNAKLNYWEVQEAIASAKAKLLAARQDPAVVVADALHRAAFDGGLGLPLHPEPSALDHLDKGQLEAYLSAALAPGSSVLAAAGVGLEDFTPLAGPLLSSSTGRGASKALAASGAYAGGALSVLSGGGASGVVHLGLAFEAKGGLADAKGAAAAAVAKALLDGPSSALPHAGGEGDLPLAGFSSLYRNTGLLGVVGAAPASQVGAVLDAASKKLETVAKGLPEPQLKAAKQAVLGAYKAQLGSAAGLAAAAAPQLLLTGKFSAGEFAAAVEALSGADVAGYVAKALKSAPTLVTYGSLAARPPRYEALAKRFA